MQKSESLFNSHTTFDLDPLIPLNFEKKQKKSQSLYFGIF